MDSGGMCVLVLLDLSSAFDTVDHDTLLTVLHRRFIISGVMELCWTGAESTCKHAAFLGWATFIWLSGRHNERCSVPQGSVVRPKKFIAYTEDLANVIGRSQLGHHLYVDDTQLLKRVRLTEILRSLRHYSQNC